MDTNKQPQPSRRDQLSLYSIGTLKTMVAGIANTKGVNDRFELIRLILKKESA